MKNQYIGGNSLKKEQNGQFAHLRWDLPKKNNRDWWLLRSGRLMPQFTLWDCKFSEFFKKWKSLAIGAKIFSKIVHKFEMVLSTVWQRWKFLNTESIQCCVKITKFNSSSFQILSNWDSMMRRYYITWERTPG